MYHASLAGLLLSTGCLRDLPAEKEVIASKILAGRSLGKGQRSVFRLHSYNRPYHHFWHHLDG